MLIPGSGLSKNLWSCCVGTNLPPSAPCTLAYQSSGSRNQWATRTYPFLAYVEIHASYDLYCSCSPFVLVSDRAVLMSTIISTLQWEASSHRLAACCSKSTSAADVC